jgi:hypothetical protein
MRKLTKIERASYTVIITRDITESTLVEVRSGSRRRRRVRHPRS